MAHSHIAGNAMAPMEEKKKYLPVQERVVRMMHY